MIRTQIQLTENQAERLKELARRLDVPMAELVRRGVEKVLADADRDEKWQRALAVVGRYHGGPSDVGRRHDDYLAEDFR
jgi:predicted DNA-binding protein